MEYTFDIQVATKYGVEEAIMIKNFQFWIAKNKANDKNLYDGHTWTYNSVRALKTLFPFWTEKQIRRILQSLVDKEVLIRGNYNKTPYDRTYWYAFKDESLFLNQNFDLPKRANESNQIVTPIPDNKPDIKPDNSQKIRSFKKPTKHRKFFRKLDQSPNKEQYLYLADSLLTAIKCIDSQFQITNYTRRGWADAFRLLHEKDARPISDIYDVMGYAFKDKFWRMVIRSAQAFRKHYSQIYSKWNEQNITYDSTKDYLGELA